MTRQPNTQERTIDVSIPNPNLSGGWGWFVEGRNLTDRRYAATTAVQANGRGLDGAYYFPGDARSVYAGLTWRTH